VGLAALDNGITSAILGPRTMEQFDDLLAVLR
jgi:hypothetical protein